MKMTYLLSAFVVLLSLGAANPALANHKPGHKDGKASDTVKSTKIEYKEGDTVLEGVLYTPATEKGKNAAIIVTHAWMGLNEYAENRAKMLAEMGYIAFAADIYGKGVRPKDAKEAGEFAGKYKSDRVLLRKRMNAALETLRKQPNVDTTRIGAIGYCFGGTSVLELARSGAPVKAFATFHGGLDSPKPEDGKAIKGKGLIMHGAIDPYVPEKDVLAFQKELNDAKVDYQFIAYSGAVHSFTEKEAGNDITKGAAYNEKADLRSWEAMKTFFKTEL